METVTSKDGTTIAFDRLGSGPPVVLVCGGSVDRTADAALAQELASDFTVFNYDRRGRGDSGDTLPYAIEREVEDLHAVIAAAGGSAAIFGTLPARPSPCTRRRPVCPSPGWRCGSHRSWSLRTMPAGSRPTSRSSPGCWVQAAAATPWWRS